MESLLFLDVCKITLPAERRNQAEDSRERVEARRTRRSETRLLKETEETKVAIERPRFRGLVTFRSKDARSGEGPKVSEKWKTWVKSKSFHRSLSRQNYHPVTHVYLQWG